MLCKTLYCKCFYFFSVIISPTKPAVLFDELTCPVHDSFITTDLQVTWYVIKFYFFVVDSSVELLWMASMATLEMYVGSEIRILIIHSLYWMTGNASTPAFMAINSWPKTNDSGRLNLWIPINQSGPRSSSLLVIWMFAFHVHAGIQFVASMWLSIGWDNFHCTLTEICQITLL